MIAIYEAANSTDAHLIKNLLQQAGISSYIRGEYLQGGLGEIPVTGLISVCVRETDASHAREILEEWQEGAMTIPESDGDAPEEIPVHSRAGNSGLRTAIVFAVGAVIGAGGFWLATNGPSTEHGIDYNGDGFVDEHATYAGDKLQRVDIDRNRDGKPDVISYYDRRGFISRSESDDDFDGRMEANYRYLHGQWTDLEVDRNADGDPDYRAEAIAGVVYREEWLDPAGNVIKSVVHKDGWASTSDLDTDGDGKLDTRRYYDERDELGRSEPVGPGS